MKYYDVVKNWKKLKPLVSSKEFQQILVRDFNRYSMGRWNTPFTEDMVPEDIESCDWRCERKGRHPAYWKYVKHGACHWVVNSCLKLAMMAEPDKDWRIVTSQDHSTVWDGDETIFDFNFLALQVDADTAFMLADQKHLPSGKEIRVYLAPSSIVNHE